MYPSHIGYELTLTRFIERIKIKSSEGEPVLSNIYLYDTGIHAEVPFGCYLHITSKSTLVYMGYIMSDAIINSCYHDTIRVALVKTNDQIPDLTLPAKVCKLIVQRQYFPMVEKSGEYVNRLNRVN